MVSEFYVSFSQQGMNPPEIMGTGEFSSDIFSGG